MNKKPLNISEEAAVQMPMKTVASLIIIVALGTMGYFQMVERLNIADTRIQIMEKDLQENTEFRIKWPRGQLGALPADSEQFMMIEDLYKTTDKLNAHIESMALNKVNIELLVGTMIELPRAAIKAKDIAKHAEFFSFGTNDLTQTTFGISRDDCGKFLNDYIENKIFDIDPFVSIDDGVGDLIEIAVVRGKKQNKKIKLGICGEHGGDPKSIHFCSKTGLDYVSCSPYRVPIARLAAAQAEIKKD